MEYILGAGVFTFGIFGALTVSNNVSSFAIIISAVGFVQWLFSVGISANLKDVEFDAKHGIRTTPSIFGVKAIDQKLMIPKSFWIYAFSIKIIHILIISLPFIFGYSSIFIYDLPIPGIGFLLITILLLFITYKILVTPMSKRDDMLVNVGLQEGMALLLFLIVLLDLFIENIGMITFYLLIILFIVWPLFWLRLLYGERMMPLE
jgi:4-hydroxybenzoate polyprenyltransferase